MELAPPRMLFERIERPYLEAMLFDGLERQVVVVTGPAGFGKTTLLATAFSLASRNAPQGGQRNVSHKGWLTISPRHADPASLVHDLLQGLNCPDQPDLASALAVVATRSGRTVLFIDALDTVPAENLTAVLGTLIASAPDSLRIVLASRQRMPFPLVQLRLRGLLTEIGPNHLSFSIEEMRNILRHPATLDVASIAQSTQGWPALVGLVAALAPASSEAGLHNPPRLMHPAIQEFIGEVVLAPLPAVLRQFLVRAVMVEDFSAALVQAMGGPALDEPARHLLGDIEPVVTTSPLGVGWLRLHPLVRAYLLATHPVSPVDMRSSHTRAAHWFADQGHLRQAVANATQAGDYDFAARIIGQAGGANLFLQVGYYVLHRLLEGLPADVIYASSELTLCHALILGKSGRLDEARKLVVELDHLRDPPAVEPVFSTLDHVAGMIDIYQDQDVGGLVQRLEALAGRLRPTAASELAWINTLVCPCYTALGWLAEARRSAIAAAAYYQSQRSTYALVFSHIHISMIGTLNGSFAAALDAANRAQDLVQTGYWNDLDLVALVNVPLAELHYLHGDAAQAERLLAEAVSRLRRGEGWVDIFSRAFVTLAMARAQLNGLAAGLAVLNDGDDLATERNLDRLALAFDIARVDLFLRADRLEPAVHLIDRIRTRLARGGPAQAWLWRQRRDFALSSARCLLAGGHADAALGELEPLLAEREAQGDSYHSLLATVISIRAYWVQGDTTNALASLRTSVALARSEGVIQPFLDEGDELKAIIRAIIRRVGLKSFSADAVDFLGRIVGNGITRPRSRGRAAAPDKAASTHASEMLTARELEVLRHLVESRSNKQIARSLDVSDVTVKFHLKNIFAKLGVSRRDMAASVARQLNLC